MSILMVLVISLLVVRVATVALTLTGMSQQMAKFQARSAFTGAGFTTSESEGVVNHPVRRRVIMLLMLMGNAGIVTAMASLLVSVMTAEDTAARWHDALWVRVALIAAMVVGVWTIAQSERFERSMSRVIRWALARWTRLEVRDFAALLHLSGGYHVTEMKVSEGDWLAGRRLHELGLSAEGVLVLGVEHDDGSYVGAPRGQTRLEAGDVLLIYGHETRLADLGERPAGSEGSRKHINAVEEQHEREQHEHQTEPPEGGSNASSD